MELARLRRVPLILSMSCLAAILANCVPPQPEFLGQTADLGTGPES